MKAFALSSLLGIPFLAMPESGRAELFSYDGFEEYPVGQVESGANGTAGPALNGGTGWGGAYNVNSAIKSLVRIEDRSASPVVYQNGEISIDGGVRALRFFDGANGTSALLRPLGAVFGIEAPVYFSFLFRTASSSPLENQDFLQFGFDGDNAVVNGNPRLSIGANVVSTTFPPSQPFRFFARSTTSPANSSFDDTIDIQAATTYFLVGRFSGTSGRFDRVDLFVNPFTLTEPGTPSASFTLDSGVASLSTFYIRTANLEGGDAYVVDELRIGDEYISVVPEPGAMALGGFGILAIFGRFRRPGRTCGDAARRRTA